MINHQTNQVNPTIISKLDQFKVDTVIITFYRMGFLRDNLRIYLKIQMLSRSST